MSGRWDVVVVGGGPAGCLAATTLARDGRAVLLLDAERFPRYHVGESLSPVALKQLEAVGAGAEVEAAGFVRKGGASFVWGSGRDPWSVYYGRTGQDGGALQVRRPELDHILLRHAAASGVEVRQGCTAKEVLFEGDRAVGVSYLGPDGATVAARARWTVDASGQAALLARQLGLLQYHQSLRSTATWSYWSGGGRLPGGDAGNSLLVSQGAGCCWYIPVDDATDLISVGVVTPSNGEAPVDAEAPYDGEAPVDRDRRYHQAVGGCELIGDLLAGASRSEPVRSGPSSAYRASGLAGPGWLLAGDAACFVDPILSPGVQLACSHGSLAAAVLGTLLDQPGLQAAALDWYQRLYTRQYETFVELCLNLYGATGTFPGGRAQPEGDRLAFLSLISGLSGAELPAALGGYIGLRAKAAARGGPPPVLGEEEGFSFLTRRFGELRLLRGRAERVSDDLEVDSVMRAAPGVRIGDEVFLPAGAVTLRPRRAVSNRFGDRFEAGQALEALLEALDGGCAYDELERRVCKALDLDQGACREPFRRWLELLADQGLVEWRRPAGVGA